MRGRALVMAFAVAIGALAISWGSGAYAVPNCATLITNRVTGHRMVAVGYSNGVLEFRDWQGNVVTSRSGFGEVTAIEAGYVIGSPYPRLFVGSTDMGGALRVIDPADVHNDLQFRAGFGRVTVIRSHGTYSLCVGSTDSSGALRRVERADIHTDYAFRSGFGEVKTVDLLYDGVSEHFLVGSTDSGGMLRYLSTCTLSTAGSVRAGFGTIYDVVVDGLESTSSSDEIVVASSDMGGAVRYIHADNLQTDVAFRSGFGTVHAVAYGVVGLPGMRSISVASNDIPSGVIRLMYPTLVDVADRSGFYTVADMGVADIYNTTYGEFLWAVSTDGGTLALHIMDNDLADLSTFHAPEPTTFILVAGGLAALILRKRIRA